MKKEAVISQCGKYRYRLWREWDDSKPCVLFVMLNPSTADGEKDDPTIRRCIGYAKSWDFGSLYVGNLYAYRATNPKELLQVVDPLGVDNQKHLDYMVSQSNLVIWAWGNGAIVAKLEDRVGSTTWNLNDPAHYLEMSKGGVPKHPLYLKKDLKPIRII